ncbi:NUDIX hydrolase [Aquabacterium sp.]|jgi:ADP-ribose pyrophosphatase YjhB (NUDIX family)|uniref:NUDIX hydrolase n=1 Tax=Aquabacterium sp. TaxID=1872578 RepID=UPI003D04C1BC
MDNRFTMVDGFKLRKKVRSILVNTSGQYLLIQPQTYADDNWTLVGGGVEHDEDFEQAIRREIREETGIRDLISLCALKNPHWFCFSEKIKQDRLLDHDGQFAMIVIGLVAADTTVAVQAEEFRAYRWASSDELADLVQVPAQLRLIREAEQEVLSSLM